MFRRKIAAGAVSLALALAGLGGAAPTAWAGPTPYTVTPGPITCVDGRPAMAVHAAGYSGGIPIHIGTGPVPTDPTGVDPSAPVGPGATRIIIEAMYPSTSRDVVIPVPAGDFWAVLGDGFSVGFPVSTFTAPACGALDDAVTATPSVTTISVGQPDLRPNDPGTPGGKGTSCPS